MNRSAGNTVVVSACLLGVPCRYDGMHRFKPRIDVALAGRRVLPVCPEVLANLGIPRQKMAFVTSDEQQIFVEKRGLVDAGGRDRTEQLLGGVQKAVELAVQYGATDAILKERSPSCGVTEIYLRDSVVPGRGLFTALLEQRGVRCRSDEELGG